jgi:hypothetical protein
VNHLLGYRVVPPWDVPPNLDRDLPPRVVTCSDHLVDPVPDADAWFPDREEAAAHATPAARVLAVGVPEEHFDPDVLALITAWPDRLLLDRTPWPADLRPLGHEVIGVEEADFHGMLCYGGVAEDLAALGIPLNAHGLISRREDADRAARDAVGWGAVELPWLPVVLAHPEPDDGQRAGLSP